MPNAKAIFSSTRIARGFFLIEKFQDRNFIFYPESKSNFLGPHYPASRDFYKFASVPYG